MYWLYFGVHLDFQNLLATQPPKCLDLLLSSFIASPLWSWQSRTEADSAMW